MPVYDALLISQDLLNKQGDPETYGAFIPQADQDYDPNAVQVRGNPKICGMWKTGKRQLYHPIKAIIQLEENGKTMNFQFFGAFLLPWYGTSYETAEGELGLKYTDDGPLQQLHKHTWTKIQDGLFAGKKVQPIQGE